MSRQTVFTWSYGDMTHEIITGERLTPDAIETIDRRMGAEFVTRVRELCDDTRTITGELVMPNLDDATE